MDETQLTEDLDERGLLADARQPGCYLVRLHTPADLPAAWRETFDVVPSGLFERVNDARALCYAGAAQNVYERLCDHADGSVRKAAIMRVCPPSHVVDVTPTDAPFDVEYSYALSWTASDTAVWVDGEVL